MAVRPSLSQTTPLGMQAHTTISNQATLLARSMLARSFLMLFASFVAIDGNTIDNLTQMQGPTEFAWLAGLLLWCVRVSECVFVCCCVCVLFVLARLVVAGGARGCCLLALLARRAVTFASFAASQQSVYSPLLVGHTHCPQKSACCEGRESEGGFCYMSMCTRI
jgi:hypothetical protein